jgi:two-component system, cell cycle sensor histidine kinase and response regulator CckA
MKSPESSIPDRLSIFSSYCKNWDYSSEITCMNIYLIDDDPDVALIVREMLSDIRGTQFTLDVYETFAEGWRAIEEEIPDILLLDLGLPDDSGVEKVKRLRDAFGSMPIVVLTSSAEEELASLSLQYGAQDYLVKGKVDSRGLWRAIEFAVQRQSLREELQKSERRIQETQRLESLGILAGGIAHDFNNILTAILGNANLARQESKENPEIQDYLSSIENSAMRAADVCRQMLDYSGKGRFEVQSLDLSRVVEETCRLLAISIHKKVELHYHLQPLLPFISGDPLQIRQAILNLTSNASESIAGEGFIKISTGLIDSREIDFNVVYAPLALNVGRYVYLEVADNGGGIEAKNYSRVFEPFFSSKFAGRGLGLPVVLGILRGHHGGVTIQSSVGNGTVVRLYFPLSSSLPEEEIPPRVIKKTDFSGRALVVDDEETIRKVAAKILESIGFSVVQAVDGYEALELLKADSNYAFVLLDMTMPRVDGIEVLHEIRRHYPKMKVLFTSGFSERDLNRRFHQVSPDGFIPKPFRVELLIEKVKELFSLKNA